MQRVFRVIGDDGIISFNVANGTDVCSFEKYIGKCNSLRAAVLRYFAANDGLCIDCEMSRYKSDKKKQATPIIPV